MSGDEPRSRALLRAALAALARMLPFLLLLLAGILCLRLLSGG